MAQDIYHSNRTALDAVSGTNTGDITPTKSVITYIAGTYIYDLPYLAKTDSLQLNVDGGMTQLEGVGLDYTTSVVGGVTRITLLTRFYSGLINNNKIYVQYLR